ncbi:hypothetical protein [Streptomyces litmocidini]|uniref:Uncharacterized protein n=1 Tax=Streptomyces litmocidini TaxID=67318 RepID=A0ABW7U379_9ACTN
MTDPLECHELLLGPEAMAYVQAEAATAPPSPPELVNELRRVFPSPPPAAPSCSREEAAARTRPVRLRTRSARGNGDLGDPFRRQHHGGQGDPRSASPIRTDRPDGAELLCVEAEELRAEIDRRDAEIESIVSASLSRFGEDPRWGNVPLR